MEILQFSFFRVGGWVGGWMGGWVAGWVGGWVGGWMGGEQILGYIDESVDEVNGLDEVIFD
jgi:hypothetical protein